MTSPIDAPTWADVSAHLKAAPQHIDLGLQRVERALSALSDPQHHLPPVVHVAGTNGKGSTIALLAAMARAAGQRVHVYTSPHLVHWGERIVCADAPLSPADMLALLQRVQATGVALTVFEALTVAAFLAFAETPADLAIIEVGLGGRLDATNVLTPAISVITPVDLDHTAFLGDNRAAIAGEKAGIIKPNRPVVVGRQEADAFAVITTVADHNNAPIVAFGRAFDAYESAGRLVWQSDDTMLDLPLPALAGRHQHDNAAVAIAVARQLGVPDAAIEGGLRHARWPARLHRLRHGPLVDIATAQGCELWLDGAHNPHGATAAASFFAELDSRSPRALQLVMGLLNTKDAAGVIAPFAGLAAHIHTITIPDAAATVSAHVLADAARQCGLRATAHTSVTDAVRAACHMGDARVGLIGSLYLAGWVLTENR